MSTGAIDTAGASYDEDLEEDTESRFNRQEAQLAAAREALATGSMLTMGEGSASDARSSALGEPGVGWGSPTGPVTLGSYKRRQAGGGNRRLW